MVATATMRTTIIVTCYYFSHCYHFYPSKQKKISFFYHGKERQKLVWESCKGLKKMLLYLELKALSVGLRINCTSTKVSIPSVQRRAEKRKVREKINDDIVESIHTMVSAMRDFPCAATITTTKTRGKKEITDNENNCKRLQARFTN